MNKWAIIDIGSNTIRLVIYKQITENYFKEVENIKAVARLRKYLSEHKILSNEGIQKCMNILKGFKEMIDFHEVTDLKCVATATIRQAENQFEVLKLVKQELGFEIQILSEEEEAYLGYLAVVNTTAIKNGVTIDIGGGSTEITYYENKKLLHSHSFPFGVVSLKEKFMKGNRMTSEERVALQAMLLEAFDSLPWLRNKQVPIIAIGGSARNIAQVHQHIKSYPLAGIHQYDMSPDDLHEVLLMMENLEVDQIEKLEGLSKDRADIILPALEVFDLLCTYVQATRFIFSKRGLREGVLYEEKGGGQPSDRILERSIDHMVRDYGIEKAHSNHVANLAKQIYYGLSHMFGNKTNDYSEWLIEQSARIYYIGQYVDPDVSSQHTFNLLAHQSIDGITHKERLILAFIASYKNWALLKQYSSPYINWFSKGELKDIRIAGSMVKLASALDSSKRMLVKRVVVVQKQENELIMQLACQGDTFVEQYQAEKQVRHLEKSLKYNITLEFVQ